MNSTRVKVLAGSVLAAGALLLMAGTPATAQSEPKPHVYHLKRGGITPPLRELAAKAAQGATPQGAAAPRIIPLRQKPSLQSAPAPSAEASAEEAATQRVAGPLVSTTNFLNFDGISADGVAPPDTNGSVGATQFVAIVNTEYAVYDKSTGNLLLGPLAIHIIWSSMVGSTCATSDGGDPVVLYDKAAGRWWVSQLEFNGSFTSNQFCMAVSTSSDATGSYAVYEMDFGVNLPDYPKVGVWPDAYYFSANTFPSGGAFTGPEACAVDRASMLTGGPANAICFTPTNSGLTGNDFTLLPSDLDGTTAPPSGEPNFFVELFTNNNNSSTTGTQLRLWKFHVDFTTPANSTFTGPTTITVSTYTLACNGGTCVPQSGTSQQLASLGDRLMFRLAYRNFADHEALVANHSVRAGSTNQTAPRWYEIRSPNGTPTVFQQGTFAPDTTTFRWMGSIAMDQAGDIAIGYSGSSSTIHPEINYTGRVPSDTLGTLEAEANIFTGAGSQNGGLTRWGDYSSMSVDPADDCTFWYATEYIPSNGSFNWHTRIADFKFTSCGSTTNGPAVTLSPPNLTFSNQSIGTTSPSQPVTLTNTGNAPLSITNISLTGANPGDFNQTNTCPISPSTLAAGANCIITVTFTPAASGARTASVTITDNASDGPQNVPLTGTGIAPSATVSPTSLNFGGEPIGVTSAPKNATVTNNSTNGAVLVFTNFSITGDFAISSNGCSGVQLAQGAKCLIGVTFTPTGIGKRTGTLTITDTATNSPQKVSLTGTGPDFSISASPTSLTVTRGNSGTSTLTLSPLNGFNQTITLTCSGAPKNSTCSISPNSVTLNGTNSQTATLTISTTSLTPTGTFTLSAKGADGTDTHAVRITLTVQ